MRVKYCYLLAWTERWTEEVEKVLKEMRACSEYFLKHAQWWSKIAVQREQESGLPPCVCDGLKAYA